MRPQWAQLLGWLGVGAVNAIVIALTAPEARRLATRMWHHAYDLGHAALLGLVTAAAVALYRSRAPRRGRMVALWGAAVGIDGLIIGEDLKPFAVRLAGDASAAPWLLLLVIATSVSVPATVYAGMAVRPYRWLRILAAVLAVQLAAVNHFLLQRDYPGVHLQLAWLAALLLGATLTGLQLPAMHKSLRRTGLATLTALGVFSVAYPPPHAVLARALSRSGSAFAPYVSRLHAWIKARRHIGRHRERVDVAPTRPPLLDAPVVVVVTIDCLRAEVLRNDGLAARMPTLFSLRNRALEFTNARTPAPATMVALSSVFTGRYYSQLRWTFFREGWETYAHQDPAPRLAGLLEAGGVSTVVVHGYQWMGPETGVVGQFGEMIYVPPPESFVSRGYAPVESLMDAAEKRLARVGPEPFFMYMHWLEAHAPYDRGASEGSDYERYLSEIELADRALVRLMRALEPLTSRLILVVAADHGEGFGEHLSQYHGKDVYDEVLRVPLLFVSTAIAPRRVEVPVSLMDLAPTLLDLFGEVTPAAMMGESLVPWLNGDTPTGERVIFSDSGRLMRAAVFPDGMKLIHDRRQGNVELYDLNVDPGEHDNLVDLLAEEATARLEVLEGYFQAYGVPGNDPAFRRP